MKFQNNVDRRNRPFRRSHSSSWLYSQAVLLLNKEFLDLAIKASRALNLDFGTVDMLLDEFNHPIVCELNSNPQFKSTFDVTNVDLSDYIRDYIISKL